MSIKYRFHDYEIIILIAILIAISIVILIALLISWFRINWGGMLSLAPLGSTSVWFRLTIMLQVSQSGIPASMNRYTSNTSLSYDR
jgi:hypothetical protein